jgi:hypothetical protein
MTHLHPRLHANPRILETDDLLPIKICELLPRNSQEFNSPRSLGTRRHPCRDTRAFERRTLIRDKPRE